MGREEAEVHEGHWTRRGEKGADAHWESWGEDNGCKIRKRGSVSAEASRLRASRPVSAAAHAHVRTTTPSFRHAARVPHPPYLYSIPALFLLLVHLVDVFDARPRAEGWIRMPYQMF